MKITILGCGPSHGVPVIGCNCSVCTSNHPSNIRWRASILIEYQQTNILIDTPPELRLQALNHQISRVDCVLFTHQHADHVLGFDDLRRFGEMHRGPIPCFADPDTVAQIKHMYSYVFKSDNSYTSKPQVNLSYVKSSFDLNGIPITPVPIMHGDNYILGYRIGKFAYLTDCSYIPPSSKKLVDDLEVLIIGALRYRPHPNHFTVNEALRAIQEISPKKAYLTHMTHQLDYHHLTKDLPEHVLPCYDGLVIHL